MPGFFKNKRTIFKKQISLSHKRNFDSKYIKANTCSSCVSISISELPFNSFYSANNFLIPKKSLISPRLYNLSKSIQLSKNSVSQTFLFGKQGKTQRFQSNCLNFSLFLFRKDKYLKVKGTWKNPCTVLHSTENTQDIYSTILCQLTVFYLSLSSFSKKKFLKELTEKYILIRLRNDSIK